MLEELSIILVNSLIFSAMVFFPLHLTGDFILFWLIFLTTTSIGIGAHTTSRVVPQMPICMSLFRKGSALPEKILLESVHAIVGCPYLL